MIGTGLARLGVAIATLLGIMVWSDQRNVSRATSQSTVQSLFLGDRDCGDDATTCAFPHMTPAHRYLHVILHDQPRNDEWRVQISAACGNGNAVAGGLEADARGFLETVVDVGVGTTAICIVVRGHNHYWATYYAAYLDDNPLADSNDVYPGYQQLGGLPDRADLDVQFIHRSPSLSYDTVKNVPAPGDPVTYTAHVSNAGALTAPAFAYQWLLDGTVVGTGSTAEPMPPGGAMTFDLTRPWDPAPHSLRFQLVPASDEISSVNDGLTVATNGLALGFWVEQGAYAYFEKNQWKYCRDVPCTGSDSFADWMQRQVSSWNGILAASRYPATSPGGIADRVRLDQITIVPDGSLPLHGGSATNSPDRNDHSVDLQWGLPADGVASNYHLQWENPFDVDWGLTHELGHARYLADLYRFDVPIGGEFSITVSTSDGKPAFNPAAPLESAAGLRPFVSGQNQQFLYRNQQRDLMACTCMPFYSSYSAVVLNRIRGRRARCGNANAPCNLGEWFHDIPPVNRIRLLGRGGKPLRNGGTVREYFDTGLSYTGHAFDDAHARTLTVAGGTVNLGADPFRAGADTRAAGHNLLLLRLPGQHGDEFCFLEPSDFNMAFWSGYRTPSRPAVYSLWLGQEINNGCNLHLPEARVNEPFATSPYTSSVRFGAVRGAGKKRYRTVEIALRDDATPANSMRNRDLRIEGTAGRLLWTGSSGTMGVARFHVPAGVSSLGIVDTTDNDLTFTAAVAVAPSAAAPPM